MTNAMGAEPLALSVVAPMYNEEENVADTARRVAEALASFEEPWELVMANDGSTDGTRAAAEAVAARDPRVRVASYTPRAGRGKALRAGFAAARGEIVVSVDFDLSYEPGHILRMVQALREDPEADIVLVSAYMPGGTSEGVPWKRLLVSRLGNRLLSRAFPKPIYTSTCIVRGYRRRALDELDLRSDGKEIHLETLRKASALGMRIIEIPGHLRARQKGRSKATLGLTVVSHLLFLFEEKPGYLFGTLGGLSLAAAGALALWWAALALAGRPASGALPCAAGLLALFGGHMLAFWLVGRRLAAIERELVALQLGRRGPVRRSERGGGPA